jgi:hypothetical protein
MSIPITKHFEVADRSSRFSLLRPQHFVQAWPARLRFLRHPANFDLHGLGVLVASLSWSAICGDIPQLPELASIYLIILISDWAKFAISLQASPGGACRSLAALISLPRSTASSRNRINPFMQASDEPPASGGPPFTERANVFRTDAESGLCSIQSGVWAAINLAPKGA